MSIIKKTITINSNIITNINLNSNFKQYGDDQGIDEFYESKKEEFINPVVDVELQKFNYDSTLNIYNTLVFYFTPINNNFVASFLNKFTLNEITENSKNFQNSFFIFDYYDSRDISTQKKLSTNYLTKKLYESYLPTPIKYTYSALYKLNDFGENPINQAYNIFIPKNYINTVTGDTINCYCRIMFYNAKNGKTINFFNNKYLTTTNTNKLFFEIEINKTMNSWKFINFETTDNNNVIIGVEQPTNSLYTTRINAGIENFTNKIENFPTGSTFDYDSINYL